MTTIIGIVIYLVIIAVGAHFMNNVAILKGYGYDSHVAAICFWLGIFGYLYVIALPDLTVQEQNQEIQKQNLQIIELLNK